MSLGVLLGGGGCGPSTPVSAPDGALTCAADVDCDDGVFCNGAEVCAPSDPTADADGCVSGAPACSGDAACDEAEELCLPSSCDTPDADGDGHAAVACGGADCDDNDPNRFPGNLERCTGVLGDGAPAADHDEDCNPCTVRNGTVDGDGDSDSFVDMACSNPWGGTTAPVGCDPINTRIDESAGTVTGADCDDSRSDVRPNQVELCGDSIDNNCDGEEDAGAFFRDADNDGRGDPDVTMEGSCMVGWVGNAEDCDDTTAWTYEGALEICDGLDNDCSLSGAAAGGADPSEDLDGDRHVALNAACAARGEAGVAPFLPAYPRDDCDDGEAAVHFGAPEICDNGVDDNCNGTPDDPMQIVCLDRDGDGYGDALTARQIMSCTLPVGETSNCAGVLADCDDTSAFAALRYPGATEVCDRVDNDCSTPSTPEAPGEDQDEDGYTANDASCLALGEGDVPGDTRPRGDCNDLLDATYPGALELCDGVDSDCSSAGVGTSEDVDGDGYSAPDAACVGAGQVGATTGTFPKTDCDDGAMAINPGAAANTDTLTCDGVDNDCNAATSELARTCAGGYCGVGGQCTRGRLPSVIRARGTSTCVVYTNGEVACWGRITHWFDEAAPASARPYPTTVAGVTDAVDVALSDESACVLTNAGTVRCWGENSNGELGDGGLVSRANLELVVGLDGVAELAAGMASFCARRSSGDVWCWGDNASGQIGVGHLQDVPMAVPVTGVAGTISLATAYGAYCALDRNGAVWCWGRGGPIFLSSGSTDHPDAVLLTTLPEAVELRGGGGHICAREASGTAVCWGQNAHGQLGAETSGAVRAPVVVAGLSDATALALGNNHTCALRTGGSVSCWGRNDQGQIDGGASEYGMIHALTAPASARAITGGWAHTCALTGADVLCWGNNSVGQLGDGTDVDRAVPARALTGVSAVSSGYSHACATLEAGEARCWGTNAFGQVGDSTELSRQTPVPVVTPLRFREVVLDSGDVSCAITMDDTVACWGRNSRLSLGVEGVDERSTPEVVAGVSGVSHLSVGPTVYALHGGQVSAWGMGTEGQLGDGSSADRAAPGVIPGITDAIDVAANVGSACVVHQSGGVSCWGDNTYGQLGDGTMDPRSAPAPVLGVTNAVRVATTGSSACVLHTDATVSCWGRNTYGQLGDGTRETRPTASPVPGLTGVVELSGGTDYTCARLGDGSLYCWGYNGFSNAGGNLGDGTIAARDVPTRVLGPADHAQVDAGRSTCSLRTDGSVWCWGANIAGSLGDGTSVSRVVPTLVWAL